MLRISPNEVSINDPEASSIIYGQTSKFEKSKYFYHAFEDQAPNLFTIRDRQQHAKDKSLISHAFSRANIIQHEGSIYEKSRDLMDRFTQSAKDGHIIPLFPAFRCMTLDTISEFAFGQSAGALQLGDYKSAIFEAIDKATHSVPFVSVVSLPRKRKVMLIQPVPTLPHPARITPMGELLQSQCRSKRIFGTSQDIRFRVPTDEYD
jgi:cytochrome P450